MIRHGNFSKTIARFMTALVVCAGLLAQAPAANAAGTVSIDIGSVSGNGTGYTYAGGVVTITAAGDYAVTGTTTSNTLAVAASVPGAVNLTLSAVSMTNLSRSALAIGADSTVDMTLAGTSVLSIQSTTSAIAGISVPAGASLRISGTGRLDVTGMGSGTGIGPAGGITIDDGTVNATGGYSGSNPGGSGIRGNVQINGGTVTAKGGQAANHYGGSGLAGTVTINGGTVNAQAGEGYFGGAGIGGAGGESGGTVTINGGSVTATGDMLNGNRGAGIGGGYQGSGGTVTINGGTVVATGGTDAAGIGGGCAGSGGSVTITNMNGNTHVTAHGKNGGAGIGGGRGFTGNGGAGGTVTITGGIVTADSAVGLGGAGIGGGYTGPTGGQITISGGTVNATGGTNSAGIGGAEQCPGGTINISGGDVTAQGGYQGAGIGCGYNPNTNGGVKGGAITISGGTVNATGGDSGAGIGGGLNASGDTIAISGAAVVTATGGTAGAGIGGGANSATNVDENGNGGTITIGGGIVTATGRNGGAGIGGGLMGNAGAITINGGRVIAAINSPTGGSPIGSGVNSSDLMYPGTNTVTINGGTVRASGGTYDIGGGNTCFSRQVTNTFNGGSIDIATVNKAPVSNATAVYRTTVTVKNADQSALTDTDVTYKVNGGSSVATRTDGAGKLYLWLPTAGSTTVQVASGGKDYAASGPVTADNAAAMTATEQVYSIDPIGNQTFTELTEGYASGSQQTKTVTINNTGTATLNNLAVSLGAGESAWFTAGALSSTTLAPGATTTFTLKAKDGVAAGSYTAHVTIKADKLTDATFQATQSVRLINVDFMDGGSAVATRTVHYNASVGSAGWPADPVKIGYDFAGWFTNADILYGPPTGITQDTTLTAKWTATPYTIAYTLDGGTVNPANPTGYTVESASITLHNPTKTGFVFAGWSGTGVTGNATSVTIPTGSTGNRSYTAHWTTPPPAVVTVTVTFDSQGGSAVESAKAEQGKTVPAPADPKRDGYTFGGWYREAACATPWNFATDRVTSDMTLFAKWTAAKFTITAAPNNAAYGSVTGGGNYATGATVTLTAAPKAGYCFVRWLEGGAAVSASNPYSFKAEKARTLTAEFARAGAPTVTAASAGYDSVNLTWSAVAGANSYEVYRAASPTGAYTLVGSTSDCNFTDDGLTTGKTYYYKARAKFGAATGGYSAAVSARPIPASPASVQATAASNTSIRLTWSAVPGASGYEITRATSRTGAYSKVATVGAAVLKYINTGLRDNKTYYYTVRAYRTVGGVKIYGGFGATASATP